MTKADLLAGWSCRHHVADLDRAISDDHPVDQEFDERASLLERGVGQTLLYAIAKPLDGTRQACKFFLSIRMGIQLPDLFFELMLTLFEIILAPPIKRHPELDSYDS